VTREQMAALMRERTPGRGRRPGFSASAYDPRMTGPDDARDVNRLWFARLVARPEPEIDLALGALHIAAEGRQDRGAPFDPAASLETLDALADRIRIHVDERDPAERLLEVLHQVLFGELGFRGPRFAEGHDPDHSRLDLVLERRVGLPISLAVVELEVAWRLGLPLFGIGLPGHFIVGGPGDLLIDPADRGRLLTRDDCQALMRRALGEGVLLNAGMLRPASRREILARMLRNLRAAHLARRDWPSALGAVELLAIIEPTDLDHGRDRGLLLGRVGRYTEALAELRRYQEARPDAFDHDDVAKVIGIFGGRRN